MTVEYDSETESIIIPWIIIVYGVLLVLVGIINLKVKAIRITSSLAGFIFLGFLAYNIGSIITCSEVAGYFNIINWQLFLSSNRCSYINGHHLKSTYITAGVLSFVGLSAFFSRGAYQRTIVGLGIGGSLAGILNGFYISYILILIVFFISAIVFSYLFHLYPDRIKLGMSWISSFTFVMGSFLFTSGIFWLTNKPEYVDNYYALSCLSLVLMILIYISDTQSLFSSPEIEVNPTLPPVTEPKTPEIP